MSRPRYTIAESTLTISAANRSASSRARSLLPAPVGPINRTTWGWDSTWLSAAQEQPIKIRDAEAEPGWTAVIALIRPFGLLHFTQQGVHFGLCHGAVSAHRAATSE